MDKFSTVDDLTGLLGVAAPPLTSLVPAVRNAWSWFSSLSLWSRSFKSLFVCVEKLSPMSRIGSTLADDKLNGLELTVFFP